LLGTLFCSSPLVAQIEGLRTRIPSDANAVVVIDVEKLFGSPVADRERWEAKREAAFNAGVTFLSPNTQGVVIAAKLDLEYGKTLWELAQVRLAEDGNIARVATRYGGKSDMIDGRQAVQLPNDSIVVELNPQMFAAYVPANRQEVARWLRATDEVPVESPLSPYLQRGLDYVDKMGTPIIMAVDLRHFLSADEIAERLRRSPLAQSIGDQLDPIVETLAGIEGAMIGITVGERPFGSIRVDFKGSAAALDGLGKPMILQALTNQGAMIEDVREWEASTKDNTLKLSGPLSTSGLRRILSVLELPPALGRALQDAEQDLADNPESLTRIATQQFYTAVTGLLDDLKAQRRRQDMATPGSVAMWYEKYAKKIDNLPILNVDEEMLMYGRDVSQLLRGGGSSLKAVGMRSATRQGENQPSGGAAVYSSYNSYYPSGSYSDYGPVGGYRSGYAVDLYAGARQKGRSDAIIRQQERTRGAASAQQMWQQIDTQSADIRRAMTQKYEVEF